MPSSALRPMVVGRRSQHVAWRWIKFSAVGFAVACLVAGFNAPARAQCQLQYVLPSTGTPGAVFGWGIAATDQFVAVGAPYGTLNHFGDGVAFVFQRQQNAWIQSSMLSASHSKFGDYFGAAIATNGTHLLISAPASVQGKSRGAVHAFVPGSERQWVLHSVITPPPDVTVDLFGSSLAMSNDTAVVGAFRDDHGILSGHAFAYRLIGDQWTLETQLMPTNHPQALVGWSVDIQGDRAIIGAKSTTADGGGPGAAYVFERSGDDQWVHAATLMPAMLVPGQGFGVSVALSAPEWSANYGGSTTDDGAVAVVGSYLDDAMGHDSGAAYCFIRQPGGTWNEALRMTAPDGTSHDYFGFSVAMHGEHLLVGAYQQDGGVPKSDRGRAYLFEGGAGGAWRPVTALNGSGVSAFDQFGWHVALTESWAFIGATGADAPEQESGAMYVFAVDGPDCNANGQIDACDISGGTSVDSDGDGQPDECASQCAADIAPPGGDGAVSLDDLLLVINSFGASGQPGSVLGDVTGDGIVNFDDLLAVINNWGICR